MRTLSRGGTVLRGCLVERRLTSQRALSRLDHAQLLLDTYGFTNTASLVGQGKVPNIRHGPRRASEGSEGGREGVELFCQLYVH